jgi:DNA/RNA-binding domain of Phe-tRNA-synthetase-like protein
MLLIIDDTVKRAFPHQQTAVFGPTPVDVDSITSSAISSLHARCEARRDSWGTVAPAEIVHWRDIFREMGAKSGLRPSVDALFRRFLRDGTLPVIGPLVDLYNWLSLAHLTPMAAYDADLITSGLTLRRGCDGEPFEPLGAPGSNAPVTGREIVYADDCGVLCRYWNWRDCHRTRVRPDTRNVVFFADLTAESTQEALEGADAIKQDLERALSSTGTTITFTLGGDPL